MVSPAKGIFKDFSSGKGGNVVTFLMEHDQLNYPEALKWLARKYNIEIIEEELTDDQLAANNAREGLYLAQQYANDFFKDQLYNTDEGKSIGLSYFKSRGYLESIQKEFELGYSPLQIDALHSKAIKEGYAVENLEKAGLVKKSEKGWYDFYRGRVIFPIHNITGRIIGFGGRTLRTDKKVAKYFNSPESEIYNKSKVLYGMYQAKSSIIKEDCCFLVEGYTDVISMHQAGIENVVASSGTSLTIDQIKLVKRFTNNITLLFDGDAAGLKAALRGVNLILEEGLNVKIVTFPDGEDPDSYAKKVSSEELESYINNESKDFIEFKCSLLLEEAQEDPIKRAELIKDVAATIALIPDNVARTVYAQTSSKILDIEEQVVFASIEQSRSGKAKSSSKPMQVVFSSPKQGQKLDAVSANLEELTLIRLIIIYGTFGLHFEFKNENGEISETTLTTAEFIISELNEDDIQFTQPKYNKIYGELIDYFNEHESIPEEKHFIQHHDPEISQTVSQLLSDKHQLSDWAKKDIFVPTETEKLKDLVEEAVIRLKSKVVKLKIERMLEQMKSTEFTNDERVKLMNDFQKLTTLSIHIDKKLGREC